MDGKQVPLCHTTGGGSSDVADRRWQALIDSLIARSAYPAVPDLGFTAEVERTWSLGSCVYYYAGYLADPFGPIGLVFSDVLDVPEQSATPFDSGGLFHGKGGFRVIPADEREAVFRRYLHSGDRWRSAFADEMRANYRRGFIGYLEGDRPEGLPLDRQSIVDACGGSAHDTVAWRWEIRVPQPSRWHPESLRLIALSTRALATLENRTRKQFAELETVILQNYPRVRIVTYNENPPGGPFYTMQEHVKNLLPNIVG